MQRRALVRISLALMVAGFAAGSLAPATAADEKPDLSNKWRIHVDGASDSDGNILFRVTPKDGTATDVTVPVQKGSGENRIAKDISAAFKLALPKDKFSSETDDGEDVLLRKKGSAPNFALVIVSSTALNTRLSLKKE